MKIFSVANYITRRFDKPISTMKLQKLAYFSQGWALAALGEELFNDDFEAWKNGPVARTLYDVHKGRYSVPTWSNEGPELLRMEAAVIDAVIRNYGELTGPQLSEITHEDGGPWEVTRRSAGVPHGGYSGALIPKKLMQTHFSAVLKITQPMVQQLV